MKKVAKKAPAKKAAAKKSVSNKQIAIGVGVATLAAAAAGVYFMTGKHSKNRKKVATWATSVKKEVVKDLEKVGKVSKSAYDKSVDTVIKGYEGAKNIDQADLMELAGELKAGWDSVKTQLEEAGKKVAKTVQTTKKAVSKAPAKKSSRK